MPAQIKTNGLLFFGELGGFVPRLNVLQRHVCQRVFHHVKQAALVGVVGFLLGLGKRKVNIAQQHGAVGLYAVKRAAANQRFQHAAIGVLLAHAFAKIKQIGELAAAFSRSNNGVHRRFACAFDCAQRVADLFVRVGDKAVKRFVYIGRQKADAVEFALRVVKKHFELVGVVQFGRHGCRHKFGRIMRFEPRGLIRHIGIRRRVRFVEAVARKFFHVVKNFIGFFAADALFCCAFGKNFAVFHHLFGLFLAHRAAQQIRTAQRVAADDLRRLHHLLLVHHNAVSRL